MVEILIGVVVILVVIGTFYVARGHIKEHKFLNDRLLSEQKREADEANSELASKNKEIDELNELNIKLETETVEQNTTIKTLQDDVDRMGFEISDLEDEIKHYKASELNYESMSIYIDQLEQTIKLLENKKLESE